jgi:Protein of unknown function (DUF3300)
MRCADRQAEVDVRASRSFGKNCHMTRPVIAAIAMFALAGAGAALPDRSTAAPAAQASQAGDASASKSKPVLKPDELDRLLAPIALYPDQLLAQMLLCASNPGKVGALDEWLASHETLKGSELQDAASKSGFEPSFVALAVFPDVVNAMAQQPDRTAQLGQAFAADRTGVFASIQRLRAKARDAGRLKSTPQQDVETRTTSSGEQVIVIEPANPQVVYVPQYNPQVVYTQPATSSTVVIQEDSNADAVAAGLIGFTAGVAIGAAIDNDYYYGPYGWRGGAYMYDDAWDDWYDAREDAREDWQDHREDLYEDRSDRARTAQDERSEREQTRQENRPESQAQREQRRSEARAAAPDAKSAGTSSQESRGYSRDKEQATRERSGTRSDAFSGYSSGRSERAASQRGQRSRGGSGGRRR